MPRELSVSRRRSARLMVLLGMIALGVIGMHVLSSGHQLVDAAGSGHVAQVTTHARTAASNAHRHDQHHHHLGAGADGTAAHSTTATDGTPVAGAVESWVNVPLMAAAGVVDPPTPARWLSPELASAALASDRPHLGRPQRLARQLLRSPHPWVLTYDNGDRIRHLYPDVRCARFNISYTAQTQKAGKELMFFTGVLRVPDIRILRGREAKWVA